MIQPLPIDDRIDEIVATVRDHRALVLVAPPGAGKTTRVAPALAADGPVLLLQPRRIAARALARRIAVERGWTPCGEVGWQVRFERRFSERTRVLVATEGILTARLRGDPLLSGFHTVILDEFHERSIHGDLGLALARDAWRARDDLRLVVMSATMNARPVADYLDGCPILELSGRAHPVTIRHDASRTLSDSVVDVTSRAAGHVLVFLPGVSEIERLRTELQARSETRDTALLPLHGRLDSEEQERALAPSSRRKVILATNIAETSLTVEGVTDVIDTGLHRVMRHDTAHGLERLHTEWIPRDAADQRAGRAGRERPGRALRLWDSRRELREQRDPEILRIDLAPPFLDVLAAGGSPADTEWLEPPGAEAAAAALELLRRLGAVEKGRLTELGRRLAGLGVHPRLGRVLIDGGFSNAAISACAVIYEGWVPREPLPTSASDVLTLVDRMRHAPQRVRAVARDIARVARAGGKPGASGSARSAAGDDEILLRALLAGFPDRVARRREGDPRSWLLAGGVGLTSGAGSGVRNHDFILALDVQATSTGTSAARIRLASAVDPEWLVPDNVSTEHRFDSRRGRVAAVETSRYGSLTLRERPVTPDPVVVHRILVEEWLRRGPDEAGVRLLRRLAFAGERVTPARLREFAETACLGCDSLPGFDLERLLDHATLRRLAEEAPDGISLPTDRKVRLEYREDGSVLLSVKLQELFGLARTPRIGSRGHEVTLSLLAPNGRPVQTTRDLASFWERTYPEVRRELRGRYPRHRWPEDPWSAEPGPGTQRRRR